MPLALAVAAPSTPNKGYDVKQLRWVHKVLTASGTYAAAGDDIAASEFGLKRIIGVLNLSGIAAASTPTTADHVGFIVNSAGTSVTVRLYESGASGAPAGEKGAEAVITGQSFNVLAIGY